MTAFKLDRRRAIQTSGGALAAAALVGRLTDPARAAGVDKPLRLRSNRAIVSTDPGYMVGGFEMVLQHACLAQLALYTEGSDWSWKPSEFVESIEQPDGRTIHFALKKGIMWYDGDTHEPISELDAEDVQYSLERMAVSEWKDKAASLDRVEVTGGHTGTIHLKTPFAPIWYTWLASGTGTIVCKPRVEELGGAYDGIFGFYCGPYRVKEWVQKQSYSLEPNPNWPGTPPSISDVKFFIVDDEKTAEIAYEAGEIDITHISTDTLARYYEEGPPPDTTLEAFAGLAWMWMGMNTEHPKLRDIRVRRAIQHAVDVDTIIEAAYAGLAPRSRGIVPPGLIGHRAETKFEKPDLDAARALVAEAGAEGLTLELKTINRVDRVATATVIQANLADIGIDVDVVPMDAGPFWNLGLESEGDDWKDLQLWLMRYGDAPDPSQMTQWYVSGQVGIWNWERWTDPEFDELFQQGLVETDEARRHDIYIRMQEIMEDTGAYVWLIHEPFGVIHRSDLRTSIRPSGWSWYVADFHWSDESA